ncbi:hypothetical protein FP742_23075 [Vibrio parahaemolyticus]|uniref:Uncharacterized protein n=1 Tax=Vibrio parahaemolyticus serotype O3:K6 (strain RIMD 2210633) TaxID=223926 RepID=Q87NU9_VIBPA|nr:hypothetical protein RK51_010105 [Vibrio parahaemolyticus]QGG33423.1 hypothetical protein GH799_10270 [Vibrio parahaemolyticus 10329]BAC60032.1 hypothetical protein [Vibrio parahaemolyticus RIMD 2210633]AVJ53889.1 hypothetical protein A6J30_25460 [Vibrio parahaemolyticus]AZV70735.1 hypothetical protein D0853_07225 [Vibrio parahaemolyticus]
MTFIIYAMAYRKRETVFFCSFAWNLNFQLCLAKNEKTTFNGGFLIIFSVA